DFEVEDGNVARFVMRRLCCAVDNEIESARAEQFLECSTIPDIRGEMGEVFRRGFEAFEIPERVTGCAEKFAPHVVINADNVISLALKVLDRFRADEAAAAGNQYCFRVH